MYGYGPTYNQDDLFGMGGQVDDFMNPPQQMPEAYGTMRTAGMDGNFGKMAQVVEAMMDSIRQNKWEKTQDEMQAASNVQVPMAKPQQEGGGMMDILKGFGSRMGGLS